MTTLEIIIYIISAIMFLCGFSIKIYVAFSKLATTQQNHYADMLMAISVTITIVTILLIYY